MSSDIRRDHTNTKHIKEQINEINREIVSSVEECRAIEKELKESERQLYEWENELDEEMWEFDKEQDTYNLIYKEYEEKIQALKTKLKSK